MNLACLAGIMNQARKLFSGQIASPHTRQFVNRGDQLATQQSFRSNCNELRLYTWGINIPAQRKRTSRPGKTPICTFNATMEFLAGSRIVRG
jgi:hypothetical protein